jgi:hypothetical protein
MTPLKLVQHLTQSAEVVDAELELFLLAAAS